MIASEAESYLRNGVLIPSNEYLIPGRLLSTESYPRVLHLLRDLSGQGIVSRWPKGVWDNQEMGKILEEYLPGIGVTAREKNRFFNFVWDLCCGGHSTRVAMFEHNNAAPPSVIREHVYHGWGRRNEACEFVRRYVGLDPKRPGDPEKFTM